MSVPFHWPRVPLVAPNYNIAEIADNSLDWSSSLPVEFWYTRGRVLSAFSKIGKDVLAAGQEQDRGQGGGGDHQQFGFQDAALLIWEQSFSVRDLPDRYLAC